MFFERPTWLLSRIYPNGIFRKNPEDRSVYLTFDDGPIPELTTWILDFLDSRGIKATFFMVGHNVQKYPDMYEQIVQRGHAIGNHTFNHVRSMHMRNPDFIDNVRKCDSLFKTRLFRPPHGIMRRWSYRYMKEEYDIVFYDVITRDYNPKIKPSKILWIVKHYTRNGSIIVFHDSLKSERNLKIVLPKAVDWLTEQGYAFKTL